MNMRQKHPLPARNKSRQPAKPGSPQPIPAGTQQNHIEIQQSAFSGPLPHPSILEGYDKIVPGAAERIIAMAESDMKHQQAQDREALRAAECQMKRGQMFAFWLAMVAFLCCMLALYMGSEAVAGIIAGTTIVGLIAAFVIGRKDDE